MKHARYLSLLLATLLMLPPITAAFAENDDPVEGNVTCIDTAKTLVEETGEFIEFSSEGFIPEGVEKTIIGADNRGTIDNPSIYPYSAIAYLQLEWKCGCTGEGSGFLIRPDVMMSAAHIACCNEHNKPLSTMTAYFGYRSKKNYSYKYDRATTFWYNSSFFGGNNRSNTEWDYSYFKLKERVGDKVGWFGYAARSNPDLDLTIVEVAGYRHGVLKTDFDFLRIENSNVVYYENDTQPGNSGCPVFDSDYYVLAIHTTSGSKVNYGCRITPSILSEMRSNGLID